MLERITLEVTVQIELPCVRDLTGEIDGGYLYSPRRKSNYGRCPFYEFMREVAPGDNVFSFKDPIIKAICVATEFYYESPKPP